MKLNYLTGALFTGVLLTTFAVSDSSSGEPKIGEVKMVKVNYDQLFKEIASHKGKVIYVDIWGDFCTPCKKRFPHVVQLWREHQKEGLVVISVAMDDEAEGANRAHEFLKEQKADFPNYWLFDSDANHEKWQKDFATSGPPIVHIYDRSGKQAHTFGAGVKIEKIDETVLKLLKE